MYKSKTMREILMEQGITRTGNASKASVLVGFANNRWNRGSLPRGANRKTNGKIGSQRTGR